MTQKLLKLTECAERSGLSAYKIREAVRRGDLPGVNVGTGARVHLRIPERELDVYLSTRPPVHRAE